MRMGALIRQLALEGKGTGRSQLAAGPPARPCKQHLCERLLLPLCRGGETEGRVLASTTAVLAGGRAFLRWGSTAPAAAQRRIQEATAEHLDLMGVPARYSSIMMAANSSEMIWLAPEDIARDLTGIAAEYEGWVRDACRTRTVQLNSADDDRASTALAELQEERRQRTIARRVGRPLPPLTLLTAAPAFARTFSTRAYWFVSADSNASYRPSARRPVSAQYALLQLFLPVLDDHDATAEGRCIAG